MSVDLGCACAGLRILGSLGPWNDRKPEGGRAEIAEDMEDAVRRQLAGCGQRSS